MKALTIAAALAGLFIACTAEAATTQRIPLIAPYRAGQAQGSVVAVRGMATIHPDSILEGTDVDLVDSDGRVAFIGFISKQDEYAFPNAMALNGKQVVMYGVIEIYLGAPATQLTFSDQLRPAPAA